MKYGDLTYKLNESFDFTVDREIKKPRRVFKYYSLADYNIDAMLNGYLYASHPFNLNDILDSKMELLQLDNKPEKVYYNKLYSQLDVFSKTTSLEKFYRNDKKGDDYKNQLYHGTSSKLGIVSLSEEEFSPLMWPHYTNESGFLIEFCTEQLEASLIEKIGQFEERSEYLGIEKINYVEKLESIVVKKVEEFGLALRILYNIKHIGWEYEKEWRILISRPWMGIPFSKVSNIPDWEAPKGVRNVYYDKEAISSITIGWNFFYNYVFNQGSTEKVGNTKEVVFRIKKNIDLTELQVAEKCNYLTILNYLSNNLKTDIFRSMHQTLISGELVRAKEKIEIVQLEEEVFKVKFYDDYLNKYS